MRYDLTNWIIHFVRDRNLDQDFPGSTGEEQDFCVSGELEPDAKAFSVLQTIIRLSGLLPGYSIRNGRTTIYGGLPAVCSTEMPIYSFAKYVQERKSTDSVSSKNGKSEAIEAANNFIKSRNIDRGCCGYANVVSTSVTNPIIQQLIKMKIATGPYDGRAILHIHGDWPKSQSIDYEECIAGALCGVLNRYLGDMFYTESRLD